MEITFLYKNITKTEERNFVEYVDGKIPAIKNLLSKFSEDSCILKISIEKFNKHDAYQVELALSLPTKTLIGSEASHAITKAVDLSKDRLISQLKKHMAHLRKDRAHKSIRDESVVSVKADVLEGVI